MISVRTPAGGAVLGERPAAVYLHPGQLLVTEAPTVVTTILGSCVSVCVRDVRRNIAGINHFLLPDGGDTAVPALAARYGDHATRALLRPFLEAGSQRRDLEVKLFGGACVLKPYAAGAAEHLGARNVAAAFALLAEHRVGLHSQDTGGHRGRKLIYDTTSGAALVRTL